MGVVHDVVERGPRCIFKGILDLFTKREQKAQQSRITINL